MVSDEPEYELKFSRDGPFDNPLVIEEDGGVIAELDVRIGPHSDGAENVEMNEGVCTKVFDGHHWKGDRMLISHPPQQERACSLCGKVQRKVDRWEDV